ncbi:cyclin-domain-containing protein [Chlamydoabsidia padenii]|nr:cyclin-domain-containing protein [Chlamydoabsidia padenii]
MTSLLPTPDPYYAPTLQYYYQPPPPVTQTLSSIRFTDPIQQEQQHQQQQTEPEMYALRTMLSAHRTLPYGGRRSCTNTKNNTLNNRLAYVEALVDTNALVIETMWCTNTTTTTSSSSTRQATCAAVVPLRTFIQEVLKRSRTTYSTLQTALFYLFRSRPAIDAHLRQQQQDKWEGAYISCGRRMFLASLVVASKFVQDKTYRNSAWAKIAGLPVAEINAAERIFLDLVDYRLYISQPTFEQWHHLLHLHVESKTQQHPMIILPCHLNTPNSPTSPLSSTSSFSSSSIPSSPTTCNLAYHPLSSGTLHYPRYHSYQQLTTYQQVGHQQQHYYEPTITMKRKRQDTYNTCLSPSSTPMPVLTISLPSSSHSSPLQTPTQISPIRWKPTSPKKRKLETDYLIHHPSSKPWKQRHL